MSFIGNTITKVLVTVGLIVVVAGTAIVTMVIALCCMYSVAALEFSNCSLRDLGVCLIICLKQIIEPVYVKWLRYRMTVV